MNLKLMSLFLNLHMPGNIADKHPQLVETLLFTAVIMFVPQGWILRPLLRAFGFGPQGTVKGQASHMVGL